LLPGFDAEQHAPYHCTAIPPPQQVVIAAIIVDISPKSQEKVIENNSTFDRDEAFHHRQATKVRDFSPSPIDRCVTVIV